MYMRRASTDKFQWILFSCVAEKFVGVHAKKKDGVTDERVLSANAQPMDAQQLKYRPCGKLSTFTDDVSMTNLGEVK